MSSGTTAAIIFSTTGKAPSRMPSATSMWISSDSRSER